LLNNIALLTDAIEGKVVFTEKQSMSTQLVLSDSQVGVQNGLHQHAQQLETVYQELATQKQNSTYHKDEIKLLMAKC
jgi:hypothetical protein